MAVADIVPLVLGEFRFAVDEPHAGEAGVVVAYAVRHRGGVLLFDTGFGFGNDELDAYYSIKARRVPDVLAEAGIAIDDVTAVVNCHLHVDHAGQNSLFPGIPIYVQPAEWEIAHTTEHTILDWIDFPGADVSADRGRSRARRRHPGRRDAGPHGRPPIARRGDRPRRRRSRRSGRLHARRMGRRPDAREGRSRAPDREAYDRSVERLKALDPVEVAFGHDREVWSRDPIDETGYPSGAVLGGELAVPCTCNPL